MEWRRKFGGVFAVGGGLLILLTAGCQTTDDPRQGGLFGYNPEAYERRLAEKQAKLDQAEQEAAAEQERSRTLEAEAASKMEERDLLAEDLASLEADLERAETELASFKGRTEAAEKKRWQLSVRLKSTKSRLARLKSSQGSDQETMKAEIKRLQERIDRLLEEAEELSKM